eukprot:Skav235731  [mRNA]  locus=scaffold1686:25201:33653:- [translate_table: standard]
MPGKNNHKDQKKKAVNFICEAAAADPALAVRLAAFDSPAALRNEMRRMMGGAFHSNKLDNSHNMKDVAVALADRLRNDQLRTKVAAWYGDKVMKTAGAVGGQRGLNPSRSRSRSAEEVSIFSCSRCKQSGLHRSDFSQKQQKMLKNGTVTGICREYLSLIESPFLSVTLAQDHGSFVFFSHRALHGSLPGRAMTPWSPGSWRSLPKHQMAEWEDKALADKVLGKLGKLPPLVQPKECDRLKKLLAEAGRGERFIVQGGDCAERFLDCEGGRLETQLKLILQMGMIVEHASGKPTAKICRIAGQYGKPRSKPTEVVEGQ